MCVSVCVTHVRYGAADADCDDVPSTLSPVAAGSIVNHTNFPEFVDLTVKKQLETNLLPMMAHMRAAFDAVVPFELRANMGPQLLRCACVGEVRGWSALLTGLCRDIVEGRRDIDVEQWKKWCDHTDHGSDYARHQDEAPTPDCCPSLSTGPVTTRTISLSDGSCACA